MTFAKEYLQIYLWYTILIVRWYFVGEGFHTLPRIISIQREPTEGLPYDVHLKQL